MAILVSDHLCLIGSSYLYSSDRISHLSSEINYSQHFNFSIYSRYGEPFFLLDQMEYLFF